MAGDALMGRPMYWTRWRVLRMMQTLTKDLQDEEGHRKKTITFQELLARRDLYPRIIQHWNDTYGEDQDFMLSLSRIKNILEGRVVSGAMRRSLDSFMVIFNLKNNYGWKDDPTGSEREDRKLEIQMSEHSKRLSDARKRELPHGQT